MRPGKRERAALKAQVQFVKEARKAFEADKAVKLTFNSIHAARIHEVDRLVRLPCSTDRARLKAGTTHGYQDNLHQRKAGVLVKRISVKA